MIVTPASDLWSRSSYKAYGLGQAARALAFTLNRGLPQGFPGSSCSLDCTLRSQFVGPQPYQALWLLRSGYAAAGNTGPVLSCTAGRHLPGGKDPSCKPYLFALGSVSAARRGLTFRSSGAPTACRAGHQALGLRPILRLLSSAPCRCRPLNSNVRPRRLHRARYSRKVEQP